MRRILTIIGCFVAALVVSSEAKAQTILIRASDSSHKNMELEPRILRAVEDWMISELKAHKYSPVKRGDVDKALKAAKLDKEFLTDSQLLPIAQQLGATAVIRVAVAVQGKPYRPYCTYGDPRNCPAGTRVSEDWGQNVSVQLRCISTSTGVTTWKHEATRATASTDAGPVTNTAIDAVFASVYDRTLPRPQETLQFAPCRGG